MKWLLPPINMDPEASLILNHEQEQVRDAVRAFAQVDLWPHAARWDREHHFPKEAHQGLAALGAYGICVPEEYGGANFDYLTLALVRAEIAAVDCGNRDAISVTHCTRTAILMRAATEQHYHCRRRAGPGQGQVRIPCRSHEGQRGGHLPRSRGSHSRCERVARRLEHAAGPESADRGVGAGH